MLGREMEKLMSGGVIVIRGMGRDGRMGGKKVGEIGRKRAGRICMAALRVFVVGET